MTAPSFRLFSRRPVIRAVFACLIAVATVLAARAQAMAETAAPPRFEPERCWFDLPAAPNARCGRLYVQENRAISDSRQIALAVVVLPPVGAAPGAEPLPVVYLGGGPGYSSGIEPEGIARWVSAHVLSPWLRDRTLVMMDYRGTGLSEPRMDCPEFHEVRYAQYARLPDPGGHAAFSGDSAAEAALWRKAAIACRDRLKAAGVDLAAYDSAASAADLVDLRRVLGYREWDVWGVSYGTRVALTLMRDHPEGIRSAILDSPYPPEAVGFVDAATGIKRAFRQLLLDCAAGPSCSRTYPDIDGDLRRAVAWLDERPVVVPVSRADTGAQARVVLDGSALLEVLFFEFYQWDRIALLPGNIARAARRDLPLLRSYAEYLANGVVDPEFSEGQQLSVECREKFPFNPGTQRHAGPEAALLAGYEPSTPDLALCPIWGAGIADAVDSPPMVSDIPTLVLAGLYDPVTPPDLARATMAGLPNGFLVEFPGIGHGVIASDACADDVVRDFLAEPGRRPAPICLRLIGPPSFDIGVWPTGQSWED